MLAAAGRTAARVGTDSGAPPRSDALKTPLVFEDELHGDGREAGLGTALPLILGGFRGLAADFVWLRVQLAWERGDEADVRRWSELATTIDPTAPGFWLNGARMLAYDFADARAREAGLSAGEAESGRRHIDAEQAGKALRYLQTGARHLPEEPLLWIEMGNIHLNRRHAPDAATACYERAVALPGAPAYAERILAGLQWQSNRRDEAVATLRRHLAHLRKAGPGAVDPLLVEAVAARLSAWEHLVQTKD
jgi:hypothetical protein